MRRSLLPVAALGAVVGVTWPSRGALASLALRWASKRKLTAARQHGVRIDLGPARGRWTRVPLGADFGPVLSEVVGTPLQGAVLSRFGGFPLGRQHSEYLDPSSQYYQAWLGAYVVFDSVDRGAYGFEADGSVRTSDVLDALDADQRLVYRSTSCPNRFPGGRTIRAVSEPMVESITFSGASWWRVTGEAETWSTLHSPKLQSSRWGRWLYGCPEASLVDGNPDYPPIRCAGEFWLRHDPRLAATCAAFVVAPRRGPSGSGPVGGDVLLVAARSLLQQVRFSSSA